MQLIRNRASLQRRRIGAPAASIVKPFGLSDITDGQCLLCAVSGQIGAPRRTMLNAINELTTPRSLARLLWTRGCNRAICEINAVGKNTHDEVVEGVCQIGALATHALEIGAG